MYCIWSSPVSRDTWESQGGGVPDQVESEDYTHVMPGIKATAFTTEVNGTVKFSYQVQAGGKWNKGAIIQVEKEIGTSEIDKKPWEQGGVYYGGGTPSFAYGLELTRPAGEDYVTVTLFCDTSGGREIQEQTVTVKHLTSQPEIVQQIPETVIEPSLTLENCWNLMWDNKDIEAKGGIKKLNELLIT